MMDLGLLLMQMIGILIWLGVMAPALMLVSTFRSFFFFFNRLMADNGGQYDPKAQAMEEIHFDWRCIVCCMVALSPLHLEQQHLPGTESVYFDLDNTPWVKCDKCHTPFIYSVGPGNLFKLSDPKVFFAHSFVVGSFRYPFYFLDLCNLFLVFLVQSFKMAR